MSDIMRTRFDCENKRAVYSPEDYVWCCAKDGKECRGQCEREGAGAMTKKS